MINCYDLVSNKIIYILIFMILSIGSCSSYDLKISEVYYDGTDEYVEIYNNSNIPFQGKITLQGCKSTNLIIDNISIGSGNVIIIGDSLNFVTNKNNALLNQGLSLTDTKEININLILSGQIIDNFAVDTNNVVKYDNKNTAREKIFTGDARVLTSVNNNRIYNVSNNYLANPGQVYKYSLPVMEINIITGENLTGNLTGNEIIEDINNSLDNFSSTITGDVTVMTGNITILTGNIEVITGNITNMTGNVEKLIDINNYSSGNWIQEIYPSENTNYTEYLILRAPYIFSGNLEIAGLGYSDKSLFTNIQAISGEKIILTKELKNFDANQNIKIIDNMNLRDQGENLQILYSGHLLDNVIYSPANNLPQYYSYSISGIRYFAAENKIAEIITTGNNTIITGNMNDVNITNNINNVINNNCYIKLQNSHTFFLENSINFISVLNNQEIQNSNQKYQCNWRASGNLIATGCNPLSHKFTYAGIIPIYLTIGENNQTICTTYYFLNLPNKEIIEKTVSNSCGSEYYYDLYQKWKIKYEDLFQECKYKTGIIIYKGTSNNTTNISNNVITGQLEIINIENDPPGKDTNKEWIEIQNNTNNPIDLNEYFLAYAKKKKKLTGIINPNMIMHLTGNFTFPNQASCVELYKGESIYDQYCYDKKGENINIINEEKNHCEVSADIPNVINNLKSENKKLQNELNITKKKLSQAEAKINKLNQQISNFKLTLQNKKKNKSSENKSSKKKTELIINNTGINKKEIQLKASNTKKITSNSSKTGPKNSKKISVKSTNNSQTNNQKDEIKLLQHEIKIHQNVTNYLLKNLKKNWPIIYASGGFQDINNLYQKSMTDYQKKILEYNYLGMHIKSYEIEKLNKMFQGKYNWNFNKLIINTFKSTIYNREIKFQNLITKFQNINQKIVALEK